MCKWIRSMAFASPWSQFVSGMSPMTSCRNLPREWRCYARSMRPHRSRNALIRQAHSGGWRIRMTTSWTWRHCATTWNALGANCRKRWRTGSGRETRRRIWTGNWRQSSGDNLRPAALLIGSMPRIARVSFKTKSPPLTRRFELRGITSLRWWRPRANSLNPPRTTRRVSMMGHPADLSSNPIASLTKRMPATMTLSTIPPSRPMKRPTVAARRTGTAARPRRCPQR